MCNSGSVEIFLQNAYHLDGRTTVFGMILEGADALDQLQYGGPSQQDDIQSMRLTAAEILN
jgi:cyclophilin family peptidyl-prolyl cis-trans isomerase